MIDMIDDLTPDETTTPCPTCNGDGCPLCHNTGQYDAWEDYVARL